MSTYIGDDMGEVTWGGATNTDSAWGEMLHMAQLSGRRMKLEAALTEKGIPETVAASMAYHLVRDEDAID